jgi:thiol-disulfide isomerase/thioredoxin
MGRRRTTTVSTLALLALAAAATAQPPAQFTGSWRAVLASPGGELPFTLRIAGRGDALTAHALNGAEQAAADSVRVEGRRILIRFDVYDSELAAELQADGRTLVGDWSKAGKRVLGFSASAGDERRFLQAPAQSESRAGGSQLSGAWAATFGTGERAQAARGELQQEAERVSGTFLTPVGDHRYLEGDFRDGVLRLSRFDGSAASLYVARLQPDGSLVGQLFRGAGAPQEWNARRLEIGGADGLPDAFKAAGLANAEGRLRFQFPDLQGRPVSLQDERFRGRVVLVNIFGSWCPNCNDEAPLLREWARRYAGRGLEIVGLAYEQTGDHDGDRRAVQRFAKRHALEYTLLLAGVSERKAAAATLPDLTGLFAFPTTIFVDRAGRVRKIHSGYAGPATGEHHTRLVSELTRTLDELLTEAAPAPAAEAPLPNRDVAVRVR